MVRGQRLRAQPLQNLGQEALPLLKTLDAAVQLPDLVCVLRQSRIHIDELCLIRRLATVEGGQLLVILRPGERGRVSQDSAVLSASSPRAWPGRSGWLASVARWAVSLRRSSSWAKEYIQYHEGVWYVGQGGVQVYGVVAMWQQGFSPEEIQESYRQIGGWLELPSAHAIRR